MHPLDNWFSHDGRPSPWCGASAMRKLLAALALVASIGLPSFALALTEIDSNTTGLYDTGLAGFGATQVDAQNASLSWFIGNRIIKPVLSLIGVLFFGLMIYGGFIWMTARGNPKAVDKGKDIIVAAVIGAVIVTSAYVITNALFNSLTTGTVDGSGATSATE